jgi:hypothetical protein
MRVEKWMTNWTQGASGSTTDDNPVQFNREDYIKFSKQNNILKIERSTNGANWFIVKQWADLSPLHYICFWQYQPIENLKTPAVEIITNGSAYFSKIGDSTLNTGMFEPKFLAVDSYWETDFKASLNGVPSITNRTIYTNFDVPAEGEVFVHQHGTISFNAADVGKTIEGSFVCIRN